MNIYNSMLKNINISLTGSLGYTKSEPLLSRQHGGSFLCLYFDSGETMISNVRRVFLTTLSYYGPKSPRVVFCRFRSLLYEQLGGTPCSLRVPTPTHISACSFGLLPPANTTITPAAPKNLNSKLIPFIALEKGYHGN